jgi:hypothetical protein
LAKINEAFPYRIETLFVSKDNPPDGRFGIDHTGVCIPRLEKNVKGGEKDEDPKKERTEQTSQA